MARVTAISAYVVADSQAIHALELIYDNSPITIGQHNMHNDWTSVKLTFHLASEMNEVLSGIECAEAFQNSGVSIKVSLSGNLYSPNYMLILLVSNNSGSVRSLWR